MEKLGFRLRSIRIGLAASLAAACLVGAVSLLGVSILPPGVAAASSPAGVRTQILVDDRRLSVMNAGYDAASFDDLHSGAVLAGSLIVAEPARAWIAAAAGIPASRIAFADPQVPIVPPVPRDRSACCELVVAARPTVPVLDVYAQAPTVAAAHRLADASVTALRRVLAMPGGFSLTATQLGTGTQLDISGGGHLRHALELMLAVLALGAGATVLLHRARGGSSARARMPARTGLAT